MTGRKPPRRTRPRASAPAAPRASRRPSRKAAEFTLYGLNACRQAFQSRPEDLLRLYFHKQRAREMAPVKKWCADHRLPYRELDDPELEKVAGGVHHEGVVMVLRPLNPPSAYDLVEQGLAGEQVAVAFDGIENPHNLGALLRSCAYFGVAACLLTGDQTRAVLTPSAGRMAEGALHTVPLYQCSDLASILRELKRRGVAVLGTDPRAETSLHTHPLPRPCVVVMGNERTGLSTPVKKRCDALIRIPGSGTMQSLNVSVALGVVLSELVRRAAGTQEPLP